MKLEFICTQCVSEGNNLDSVKIEVNENSIYEQNCQNGHLIKRVLLNERFEILFELGVSALSEGYTREAVSSFASSLERFHEYCIKFLLLRKGLDASDIETTWKHVSKQSERQLGAFYFLLLSEEGLSLPEKTVENWSAFRNNVIHQGFLPSEEKVISETEKIFGYMKKIKNIIKDSPDFKATTEKMKQLNPKKQNLFKENSNEISVVTLYTAISLTYNDDHFGVSSLREHLEIRKQTGTLHFVK